MRLSKPTELLTGAFQPNAEPDISTVFQRFDPIQLGRKMAKIAFKSLFVKWILIKSQQKLYNQFLQRARKTPSGFLQWIFPSGKPKFVSGHMALK